MFQTILVPTDGSNHAARAVEVAAGVADKFDAKLVILHVRMHGSVPSGFTRMAEVEHVIEKPRAPMPEWRNMSDNLASALENVDKDLGEHQYFEWVGERILAEAKSTAKQSGAKNVDVVAVDGDAAEEIIELAKSNDADLIVIGTRGLGDLKGLIVGSVSHKVGQLASCPCMTVRRPVARIES